MNILGISCFYHDSAACLLRDGRIVAAAQEERFNREKYSSQFPLNAINYCLQSNNLTVYDIDKVGFYEKPFLKFSRAIISHLKAYPFSLKNFLDTTSSWLEDRLIIPLVLKREVGYEGEVLFIKHHLSHAASAFLVSPFDEAAILTADALGEWATMTYGVGVNNTIKTFGEMHFPDSLGLLYTAIATYLGFRALSGEGKVMGLASYGKPLYLDKFKDMVAVKSDGSFKLNSSFFGFNKGSRMYSRKFVRTFGAARNPGGKIEQRHYDMAASLQEFVEKALITIARNLYSKTKIDKLCLAGGVFLNCIANSKILEGTAFNEVFIQPSAGDAGGALGVASYIYHSILNNPRNYVMTDAYLGPDFSDNQTKRALMNSGLDFKELDDSELAKRVAKELSRDKIVGWFQGRMEFGPRALGNRSILANPCNPAMKELVNSKVKKRESFRPYAPAVLEEKAGEFFESDSLSPFMLLASCVKKDKAGFIPAVTHVDGTARVQTVSRDTNPKFWQLIKEFEAIKGVPVVLNTSFNLRGRPIVCAPEDAILCFKESEMDCLALGKYFVTRRGD